MPVWLYPIGEGLHPSICTSRRPLIAFLPTCTRPHAAVRGGSQVACSFADAVVTEAVVEEAFNSASGNEGWRDLTNGGIA